MTARRSGTEAPAPARHAGAAGLVRLLEDDRVRAWGMRAATTMAALRTAIGVTALLAPAPAGRAWIGAGASGPDRSVLLRALGGRDLALGAGALLSARRGGDLPRWVRLAAAADLVDALATVAAFGALPGRRRWAVLVASAGAGVTGLALAASPLGDSRRPA